MSAAAALRCTVQLYAVQGRPGIHIHTLSTLKHFRFKLESEVRCQFQLRGPAPPAGLAWPGGLIVSDCTATITSRCLQAQRTNCQINEMYDLQTISQPNLSLNLKLFPGVELAQLGSSCKTSPADQWQQHPGGSLPVSEAAA